MTAPVATFTFRRPVDEDIAAAARVLAAEEAAVRGRSEWGVDETRDWWAWSNLGESWFVDADGRAAAIGLFLDRDPTRVVLIAAVDPEYAGRGISTELLTRAERRGRELGMSRLQAGTLAGNEAAVSLFERLGFREVRHFYRMRIEFDGAPDPPEWPSGITVSTFRRDDARAFKAALDDVFAEEWGHVSLPFEDWKRQRVDDPHADFSLWFLARDGDEVAGVLRGEPQKHGGGSVGALGVRRPWRRRGLGLALLQHAFCEFHRRGLPHVTLGVDAENPTGATRLYERAGMRVDREDVVYEKELS